MNEQIEKLTSVVVNSSNEAITLYTNYFIIQSASWIAVGVLLVGIAYAFWKERDEHDLAELIAVVLVGLAVLTIPINLPVLLSPKAYAIHQLIKDVSK